jgi:hypothetical protein
MSWWVLHGGIVDGPHAVSALLAAIEAGRFDATSLAADGPSGFFVPLAQIDPALAVALAHAKRRRAAEETVRAFEAAEIGAVWVLHRGALTGPHDEAALLAGIEAGQLDATAKIASAPAGPFGTIGAASPRLQAALRAPAADGYRGVAAEPARCGACGLVLDGAGSFTSTGALVCTRCSAADELRTTTVRALEANGLKPCPACGGLDVRWDSGGAATLADVAVGALDLFLDVHRSGGSSPDAVCGDCGCKFR